MKSSASSSKGLFERSSEEIINELIKQKGTYNLRDKQHLEDLQKFQNEKKWDELANFIQLALLSPKYSEGYKKTLKPLLNYFNVEDTHDRNLRILLLTRAINSGSLEEVKKALDTGSAPVLNDYSHTYGLPLGAALVSGNKDIINYLKEQGASFAKVKIDNAFAHVYTNKSYNTALHATCELGLYDDVVSLLNSMKTKNVNEIAAMIFSNNLKGLTPLEIALANNQEEIAKLIINTYVNLINAQHIQPNINKTIQKLVNNKSYHLLEMMLEAGYKFNYDEISILRRHKYVLLEIHKNDSTADKNNLQFIQFYKKLKQPFRIEKEKILEAGSKRKNENMSASKYDETVEVIFDKIHFSSEISSEKIDELKNKLNKIVLSKDETLKPLIEFLYLGTQGVFDLTTNDKFLRGFISNDLKDIAFNVEFSNGIAGRHAVYVRNHLDVFAILLHEFTHLADDKIHGAYYSSERFIKMKNHLEEQSKEFYLKKLNRKKDEDTELLLSIYYIFKYYGPEAWNQELLVKVPQIIGQLDVEKGLAWLKKNMPDLLDFYINEFNPACDKYIDKIKIERLKFEPKKEIDVGTTDTTVIEKREPEIEENTETRATPSTTASPTGPATMGALVKKGQILSNLNTWNKSGVFSTFTGGIKPTIAVSDNEKKENTKPKVD